MIVIAWITAGLAVVGAALAATLLIVRRRLPAAGRDALVREMTQRVAQNPRDVAALQALADICWRDGAWQDAAERYGRLLGLVGVEPGVDEFTATLRRGASAWRLGRLEDASRDLMLARTKNGRSFEAAYYLGCLEEARGAREEAAAHLSAACALDPEHGDAVRMLGLQPRARSASPRRCPTCSEPPSSSLATHRPSSPLARSCTPGDGPRRRSPASRACAPMPAWDRRPRCSPARSG
jgi:tetratricopeptide (TPR) repeat protein